MSEQNLSLTDRQQLLFDARHNGHALGKLLMHHARSLRWIARQRLDRRIRHRVSESDVIQEAFANAIRCFDEFRGVSPADFSAWLRKILSNCIARQTERHLLTARRDARREVSLQTLQHRPEQFSASFKAAPSVSPLRHLQDTERLHELTAMVEELPAEQRECVKLRHLDGLRFREVGLRLRCTETTARTRYARAIERLRREVANREGY